MVNCIRCSNELRGKQKKYCSERCSKLYLKAQYRQRNKTKVNAYNREYRAKGMRPVKNPYRFRKDRCYRCLTKKDLQTAHVKPLDQGGYHDVLITFCRTCHYYFDKLLKDFWSTPESNTKVKAIVQAIDQAPASPTATTDH